MAGSGSRRTPRPAPGVVSRELGGEYLLVEPRNNAVYALRGTAAEVWKGIEARTLPDLAEHDLDRVLAELEHIGLISGSAVSRRYLLGLGGAVALAVGIVAVPLPAAAAAASPCSGTNSWTGIVQTTFVIPACVKQMKYVLVGAGGGGGGGVSTTSPGGDGGSGWSFSGYLSGPIGGLTLKIFTTKGGNPGIPSGVGGYSLAPGAGPYDGGDGGDDLDHPIKYRGGGGGGAAVILLSTVGIVAVAGGGGGGGGGTDGGFWAGGGYRKGGDGANPTPIGLAMSGGNGNPGTPAPAIAPPGSPAGGGQGGSQTGVGMGGYAGANPSSIAAAAGQPGSGGNGGMGGQANSGWGGAGGGGGGYRGGGGGGLGDTMLTTDAGGGGGGGGASFALNGTVSGILFGYSPGGLAGNQGSGGASFTSGGPGSVTISW